MKRSLRFATVAALTVWGMGLTAGNLFAGTAQLYTWDGDLEGWTAANATLANSTTLGVTQGSQSLLIDDLTSGFKNDAGKVQFNSGPAFAAFNQAGARLFAGDTDVKLEFDLSWDNTNVTGPPAFAQLGMFLNSTGVGFTQYGTGELIGGNVGADFPKLEPTAVTDGVTLTPVSPGTVHVAIPLGTRIAVGPGTFFQIGFKANGGWGGSVDWAIDNMTVTGGGIVPEPATLALVGVGCVGILATSRRRRS